MKYFLPFFSVLSLFLIGCSSQSVLHEYQGTDIVFGSGGGFTGRVSEYKLSSDGALELNESIVENKVDLQKLKKSSVKKIYSQLKEINFTSIDFNHPGNVYYFIKQSDGQSEHEVVWGDTDNEVPTEVRELYDLLVSSMK